MHHRCVMQVHRESDARTDRPAQSKGLTLQTTMDSLCICMKWQEQTCSSNKSRRRFFGNGTV